MANFSGVSRLPIGSKKLSLDPVWAEPPIADIEVALLRNAAFPELARENGLAHEFVLVDPAASARTPAHEDLAMRIGACAGRLRIPLVVIGHEASAHFGNGGFPVSTYELDGLTGRAKDHAEDALRDRLRDVLASSRFSTRRHVFIPAFDAALLHMVLDLAAEMAPKARPFIHLATWWEEAEMPHAARLGGLHSLGSRIDHLNSVRPSIFLYAWSRALAQRLRYQIGVPVQPLDTPPELSLEGAGEAPSDRFTVGFLSSTGPGRGFDRLAAIVRAANQSATNPQRTRFVIQVRPDPAGRPLPADVQTHRAELMAMPERNVSLIEDYMPRPLYLAALKRIDALLLPYTADESVEYHSTTALHAMAAGKPIITYDGIQIAGAPRSRILRAADDRVLGEIVSDLAADMASARKDAAAAKSSYWATLRPSRLFAELLYGPLIINNASGVEAL
ncbi:hypothetical protein L1787_24410 [Acuticoccus sp. M5D2P5]|uniref:hypothetical protein n=1 Tax=Acuticoccus kalidii TaxID=2910977 RepID=UPI001F3C93D4|nr:hypothetical protein [Acuticoccus kalidii]MCF3936539.1 hypothetical protein [Acuticoccus kalidii]